MKRQNRWKKSICLHTVIINYFTQHVVIEWLVEQGWLVVLSVSPAKQDLDYNHGLMLLLDEVTQTKVLDTQGQLSIPQAVTLLQAAELYVGIDTSITHLAAACGTKTFALFGPTPPTNFGPWPNGFIGSQPYQLKKKQTDRG